MIPSRIPIKSPSSRPRQVGVANCPEILRNMPSGSREMLKPFIKPAGNGLGFSKRRRADMARQPKRASLSRVAFDHRKQKGGSTRHCDLEHGSFSLGSLRVVFPQAGSKLR